MAATAPRQARPRFAGGIAGLLAFTLTALPATGKASTPEPAWIDVSHSLGFPLGGLGTGYSVFGPYGFVRLNLDDRPRDGLVAGTWEYTAADARRQAQENLRQARANLSDAQGASQPAAPAALARLQKAYGDAERLAAQVASPAGFAPSAFGFVVRDSAAATASVLQTTAAPWLPAAVPFERATATALPPRGRVVFTDTASALRVTVDGFTPLLPHDLAVATLPVQVFDVTVENAAREPRQLTLALEHGLAAQPIADRAGRVLFASATGQLAFAGDNATATERGVSVALHLAPGATEARRFYVAWHYPKVDRYLRYYTRTYADASVVLDVAQRDAGSWSRRIDAWHAALDVPVYLKRLWFGSLASVMTSTFLTADPYFFEVETPHRSLNTMDVCVYSNWAYLINWPELERMDMDQYFKSMKIDGPRAGLVWHSLWEDAAKYVEEPTFLVRLRRDALWFNDRGWTRSGFPHAVRAARRVFAEDNQDGLVVSRHGNQSYDIWRMPGVSSYVNSAWVYGLASLGRLAAAVDELAPEIVGEPLDRLLTRALASYDRLLWNPETRAWNLFHRTAGADQGSTPDTLFTDQLFGRWVVAIDRAALGGGLPDDKVRQALRTLYAHNRVEDPRQQFRGWVNGMRPGRIPDTTTGYHARTFWFGAQLNLASLLGLIGEEAASLDVIQSIERSLGNNTLAAGEWNRSLNDRGEVIALPEEVCKDTPRFAPYPRYKSSWEYLVRILGLTMDERALHLAPFRTLDFSLHDVRLAGLTLDVRVQSGWTRVLVDDAPAQLPLTLSRDRSSVSIQFLR